ncbi:MAG: OsmC family protein [Elusimicrobiota bacterium]
MTTLLPHTYSVALHWKDGPTGTLFASPRPPIPVGKPPQFDGSDAWWSPEHLLLASAASCFMTTYLAMAERRKLTISCYRSQVSGRVEQSADGLRFVSVLLTAWVEAADKDQESAERLLESAKQQCLVSNSLKVPVTLIVRRAQIEEKIS